MQFLPHVSPSTAAVAGSLSALIATTLVLARNPASWYFPEDRNTAITVFATFALVLACALIPDCMGAWKAYDGVSRELGSDSTLGAGAWTAAALAGAATSHPEIPTDTIAPPMPMWVLAPWQVAPDGPEPDGDPGPGGPKWGWGKIGALIGLGALLATLLSSSGPLPSPQPNPAPAPLPTPVPTPLPTPDGNPQHRGRLQIQGKDLRRESSWPWALSTPPKKTIALAELAILWNELSKNEQRLRNQAYPKAQNFIQRGPHYAGRPWKFQNPNLPSQNTDARIDIEIATGVAFED